MKTKQRKIGFTIVELLTVMAVIAMLMGILVPALNLVRRLAKDVNQKAEFHSIDVALATYINDTPTQQYPESTMVGAVAADSRTVGAQRLAEALLGRDLVGFDPNSTWDAKYDNDNRPDVYATTATYKTASLERRQGPYLNPANAEVFQPWQLFSSFTTPASNIYQGTGKPAPVLTDIYRVKNVVARGRTVMAGTPILYYKANTATTKYPDVNNPALKTIALGDDPNCDTSIYDSIDNEQLIKLGTLKNQSVKHMFDPGYLDAGGYSGQVLFYKAIMDRKITSQTRPYNMTSYILISAGQDGIYGTRDDIYNFQ